MASEGGRGFRMARENQTWLRRAGGIQGEFRMFRKRHGRLRRAGEHQKGFKRAGEGQGGLKRAVAGRPVRRPGGGREGLRMVQEGWGRSRIREWEVLKV